jgi:hypothetical protein
MINKLPRLFCAIAALGLLFASNAWTAPAVEYYAPSPPAPQLSSNGNALYTATPPVVYVADPNPSAERVRVPAQFDLLSSQESATPAPKITYVPNGQTDDWGAMCITFPEEAKPAFTAAATIWSNIVRSPVPITIRACWSNIGPSTTLGYSGGEPLRRDFTNAPRLFTYYKGSLANALAGIDLDPTRFDMHITCNSNSSWYYGTDGNPPSTQMDLMTVALHEIAHGLNFSGSMSYKTPSHPTHPTELGWGYELLWPDYSPNIYDTFMRDSSGQQLISAYDNFSPDLAAVLTSDNLWFHGTSAMAANGGQPVKMYAPSPWVSGSSYDNLDYNAFHGTANQLMVHPLSPGSAVHDPGPIAKGILKDVGWQIPVTLRETETNNTFAQANAFQLNGETFAGQLSSQYDVDIFKFTVPVNGVISFFIRPEDNSRLGAIRFVIRDASSTILASRELTSDSEGIYLKANVAKPGDYYLIANQISSDIEIFDQDYHIIPTIQTDPVSITHREIEPNNTPSQGNRFFLTNGETYSGQLHYYYDVDYFEYYVEGPGVLSFFIKPENNDGSGAIRVTIRNSLGQIIAASRLLTFDSPGMYLTGNVAISGYYYLVVDQYPDFEPLTVDYQITPYSTLQAGGTVIIHPYPDTISAPWTLTGPGGYNRSGTGNQTLPNLTPGNYTITWGDVPDWTKPSPASSPQTLLTLGSITFTGTYSSMTSPQIQVTPSTLNFGYVAPGSYKEMTLEVKNIGVGTLTGMVSDSPPFSIASGGTYNLGAGQPQQVVVRYTAPLQKGSDTGSLIFTGGGGITIHVSGTNRKAGLPWLMLLLGN